MNNLAQLQRHIVGYELFSKHKREMEIGCPYINRLKQVNVQMDGIKVPYLSHLKINSPPGMFFLDVHFSLEAELYQKHTTPHQYKRENKHTLFIYSLRFYIYLLKFATLFQADMQSDKLGFFPKKIYEQITFFSFFSAKNGMAII